MSRAFGDCHLKRNPVVGSSDGYSSNGWVSVWPDVQHISTAQGNLLFISATDGLTDVMSTARLLQAIEKHQRQSPHISRERLCDALVLEARQVLESVDDITVVSAPAL
jgi:serine/threonine protein phosphatase PrpC